MTHDYARGPLVVKYGGNALPGDLGVDPVLAELAGLAGEGEPVVVVHGGGPEIDRALAARKVATRRVDGLRVTDQETLDVTEAVLCGTLNKRIVRACGALGLRAVGISGQDGGLLVAGRHLGSDGSDLGFVGSIVRTNPGLLLALIGAGFVPIVAPLAVASDYAHAYNVNADSAAAAIAASLEARAFVVLTDVARILRDPADDASGIDRMSVAEAETFALTAACRAGMKPKVEAAVAAVRGGAAGAYICAATPGAIGRALAGDATVIAR